jgi:hypothetical protein
MTDVVPRPPPPLRQLGKHLADLADALAAGPRRTAAILVGQGLVLLLVAWPVMRVHNLALTDYPNHLARAFIEQHLEVSPALQAYYHIVPGFYSYYSMDVGIRLLTGFLGVEGAAHVFLVLAVMMPVLGTFILFRTIAGRWSLWPVVAGVFAYGSTVAHGFAPFNFTLGATLIAFAGWIASEDWPAGRRWLVFTVIAATILAMHLFVVGMFGVLLGSWELGRSRFWTRQWWAGPGLSDRLLLLLRRQGAVALVFLPPALLLFLIQHGPMGAPDNYLAYDIVHRLMVLFDPVLFLNDWEGGWPLRWWEIMLLPGFAALLAAGYATRQLRFDPRLAVPVAATGLMALLMLYAISNINDLISRFPLLVVTLVIAGTVPAGREPIARGIGAAAIAALLVIRIATVAPPLARADQGIAEMRQIAQAIPRGARVLPIGQLADIPEIVLPWKNFWHITGYLVLDRQTFFPLFFTSFDVRINDAYLQDSAPQSLPVPARTLAIDLPSDLELINGERNYWSHWQTDFDYVVAMDFGSPKTLGSPSLALVAKGSMFSLYKIIPR